MRSSAVFALPALLLACTGDEDSGGGDSVDTAEPAPPKVWLEEQWPVSVEEGVVYAQGITRETWEELAGEELDLLVDVYTPDGAPEGRPGLVVIHGGGFVSGSRTQTNVTDFARWFAARGFVCAAIDYRLDDHYGLLPAWWSEPGDSVALPDYLPVDTLARWRSFYPAGRDAKTALRWFISEGPERYGVDPERISVTGGSAGAFLAVMLGASDAEDYLAEVGPEQDPTLASAYTAVVPSVDAVIELWGASTLLLASESYDGQSRLGDDDPPMLVVHGMLDDLVPPENGQALEASWGGPVEAHYIEDAPHGAWGAEIDGRSISEVSLDFLLDQTDLIAVE